MSDFSLPKKFLNGQHAFTAWRTLLGFVLPCALIILAFDRVAAGVACALGAFCVSLVDVPAPLWRKHRQMLRATATLAIASLLALLALQSRAAEWAVVFVVSLCAGLATAYGPLAASTGICALLGIDLIFAQHDTGASVGTFFGWLVAGGIWYTYFSLSVCRIVQHQMARRALAECLFATADYFHARSRCYVPDVPLAEGCRVMMDAQTVVMDAQRLARDVVLGGLDRRKQKGWRGSQYRLFNLLVDVVDVHDSILATHGNFEALRTQYAQGRTLDLLCDVAQQSEKHLLLVAEAIVTGKPLATRFDVHAKLRALAYEARIAKQEGRDSALLEAHAAGIEALAAAIRKLIDDLASEANTTDIDIEKAIHRYHRASEPRPLWQTLRESHLATRYALRLALGMTFGMAVGERIGGHGTWVMLTVMVVMSPTFGANRQRSRKRLAGTLLGCAAIPLLLWGLAGASAVLIGLIVVSYALCFALARPRTYIASVFFCTVAVLLLYHFLVPGWSMVEQRALDTLIGSVIGAFSVYLFPSWEYQRLAADLHAARRACRHFASVVFAPELDISDYRLSRRDALFALATLSLGYQRMLQEPPGKQRQASEIGEWLLQCNALISALASLFRRRRMQADGRLHVSDQAVATAIDTALAGAPAAEPAAFAHGTEVTASLAKAAAALMRSDRLLSLPGLDRPK